MIWFLPETVTLGLERNTISGTARSDIKTGKNKWKWSTTYEICTNYNLALTSTYFSGSLNSKVTWMNPRSRHWHQLDHVIFRRRQSNSVTHSRSMHSADCGTDHALVRSKLLIVPRKYFRSSTKYSPSINSATMKNNSSTEAAWLVSWKRHCVHSCCGSKTWGQTAAEDTKHKTAKARLLTAKANIQRLVRAALPDY